MSEEDTRRDEDAIVRVVACIGCGRVLYIRGPNAVRHDSDLCQYFIDHCVHQLYKDHENVPSNI